MGSSSSQEEEPVNSEQAELPNESTVTPVTLPPMFVTKNDFIATWFSWKNEFLAYLKSVDNTEEKKHMWGIMLLNRMGPVGQEIHRSFSFYDKREDINVLFKKFDIYWLYGDKKRGDEDLDKYINDLKCIAMTWNYVDIVKEKIIQDISTQRFTGKAAILIDSKGENLISYLQSLDLNDIILFWKQCEDLMTQKVEEIPKQDSFCTKSNEESTRRDTEHNQNRCPAWGNYLHLSFCAQCNRCKQLNRVTDNSKVQYIYDCTKCGMSHVRSRCPAHGELCAKCGKINHFSFKCQTPFVNNCSRCGTNHVAFMCPARGQICRRCNKPNHFEEQCKSKFNGQYQLFNN